MISPHDIIDGEFHAQECEYCEALDDILDIILLRVNDDFDEQGEGVIWFNNVPHVSLLSLAKLVGSLRK